MKNKATHRGTCQACGRVQCLPSNLLAKHGYTVDWGFFNGTCCGSDRLPLEQDKTLTENIIKQLREVVAPAADKLAADLEAGIVFPKWRKEIFKDGKHQTVEVAREELSEYNQGQQLAGAIHRAKQQASHARSHARDLEGLIASRHGQPLQPIPEESKKELAPGVRVQLGGAKGEIFEIVELKHQVARGCGPYTNGKYLLHAIVKRESNGRVTAVLARSIRQSSIL